jgi:hypothetical protein
MSALTPEQYEAAVAEEWGQFVAIAPIYFDGVLAVAPGAPVPASNVKRYSYLEQGLVAKTNTKAAKAVTGQEA